ncbi:hypothetical protein ACFQHO_05840 [Actinomadura yumaensis]|uniref:hypothetical protein n=1 Tax=Actinomadura yumaensis TaxID=111807 RepID=UPI00360C9CA6
MPGPAPEPALRSAAAPARRGPRYEHGLVIGAFHPPRAGHHLLIDTAAAACARVTVTVTASAGEAAPLALRVARLREAHPQPHIAIVPVADDAEADRLPDGAEAAGAADGAADGGGADGAWRADVAAFRAGLALRSVLGVRVPHVDAVFTFEPYGAELARRFSAAHVPVPPPG